MAVTAPFQFARIPRAVWFPDWSKWVSHDVPFQDGYSGTIDIEIEAMTPLLIGGERRKATETQAGEVWPVQLPDGTYAIPGSSLQGMIRNILEIACFGKLGPWVEKRRFGIRDISGSETGKAAYASRMTSRDANGVIDPKTRAGWLQRSTDGKISVRPCAYARIDADNIEILAAGLAANNLIEQLTAGTDAKQRYDAFLNTQRGAVPDKSRLHVNVNLLPRTDAPHSCGPIWYTHCTANGAQSGQLVFTGKPVGGNGSRKKHFEFVFYEDPAALNVEISEEQFDDFKLIHQPPKGSGQKENPNWAYWKRDFENGKPVPIFYIEEVDNSGNSKPNTVAAMGTAFMFKLAHLNDTHTMLEHSSGRHSDKSGYDLPSLIFGGIGDSSESTVFSHSLKRRATFDWAIAEPTAKSIEARYSTENNNVEQDNHASRPTSPANATVLLGPKPSYYPIYVRQPARKSNELKRGNNGRVNEPFATYTPAIGSDLTKSAPELSGVKIWPVSGKSLFFNLPRAPVKSGTDSNKHASSKATHVHLHALPEKTKFITRLHVHNLRACELGALLWALTFRDAKALGGEFGETRHRIGMGKPYGMGEIRMRIENVNLTANQGEVQPSIVADCVASFETKMNLACLQMAKDSNQSWIKGSNVAPVQAEVWQKTAQVEALIKAANVGGGALHSYMKLKEFIQGKLDGYFLTPYADHGFELERKSQYGVPVSGGAAPNARFAFVEDAPIQRKRDGALGFLREKANSGTWRASFDGGMPEIIYPEDVTVIGLPDE